ncbi:MAG: hypothetical protein ACKV2U_01920 [Bryobacteraceae bacterium]
MVLFSQPVPFKNSLFLLLAASVLAQSPAYKVGDRVEALDIAWYKGAITQIGTGNNQGNYLVKYDDFSTQRYHQPNSLRPGGPPDAPKVFPAYNIGDVVEGYDGGWHAGKIVEIRAGKVHPEYLLKYEKFSSSRWHQSQNLRAAGTAEAQKARDSAAVADGPHVAKYIIYSYGAVKVPPLYLGHFELMAGNKYRISRGSAGPYYGEGAYRFNPATATVEWLSGPLATPDWGGKFSVDRARHSIALRTRTIASEYSGN